jgi:hypothetical protein
MTRPVRIAITLAEIALLIVLVALWALIVDYKCSRNLDANEITFEEVSK